MAETLLPPPPGTDIPKTTPEAKPEVPTRDEYAFYKVYPFPEKKSDVLNNGFEEESHLAVPFTPRAGHQSGQDGRQLAIGTDPNDPHKLVIPEDVRPYDGMKDDRRNKAPNEVDNVVVFERWGNKYRGYTLYEVTGRQKFEKVERGAEFTLGEQTLTVVGLDQKGDILFYKGKLDYYPEQRLPKADLPENSGKKMKTDTLPKSRFPSGFLKRKSVIPAEESIPKVPEPAKPSPIKFNEYGEIVTEGDPGMKGGLAKGWWNEDYSSLAYRLHQESLTSEAYRREVEAMARKKDLDPATDKKVESMWKIKLPDFDKRVLRLLPLAALLLVAVATQRSTIPNISFPGSGQGLGKGEGGSPSGPVIGGPIPEAPYIKPEVPAIPKTEPGVPSDKPDLLEGVPYRDQPWNMGEFRGGLGLDKVNYVSADYTVRDDYQAKINPNLPREGYSEARFVEGYSISGMVQSDLAKVFNPELKKEAERAEAEGRVLPEGDQRLLKTIQLLKEKLAQVYRPKMGEKADKLYDAMVGDFETRMRSAIARRNEEKYGDGFRLSAVVDGKVTEGKFEKWDIGDKDMDTWFGLGPENSFDGNRQKWKDIRDDIVAQINQGSLQQ